jgi:hypothetical protein
MKHKSIADHPMEPRKAVGMMLVDEFVLYRLTARQQSALVEELETRRGIAERADPEPNVPVRGMRPVAPGREPACLSAT